jgi:hypothetical protein
MAAIQTYVIKEQNLDGTTNNSLNRNKIELANCAFIKQIILYLLILICFDWCVRNVAFRNVLSRSDLRYVHHFLSSTTTNKRSDYIRDVR